MKAAVNLSFGLIAAILLANGAGSLSTAPDVASRTQQLSLSGGGHSSVPLISADGRYVVFVSEARNLVTNDGRSPYLNVYARDLAASNTVLVSVNLSGVGGGNDSASAPSVSSNGRFIAFESAASNLVANDTNLVSDVFVRDLTGNTTTLVSVESTGARSGNGPSVAPLVTADGRWVIFESAANDLVAEDTNGVPDVFARDLQSGATQLVSVNASGAGAANGPAESAAITPDGRVVAFVKRATNDVGGVMSGAEVYVRDLQANSTTWASSGVASYFAGSTNGFGCSIPVLSGNGQILLFLAGEFRQTNSLLFSYDRQASVLRLVNSNVPNIICPQISADGRRLAFPTTVGFFLAMTPDGNRISFVGRRNNQLAVFLDGQTGFTLVSVNTNGTASAPVVPSFPAISADGQLVAFESLASDLVAGDWNQSGDIFLRDVVAGTTQLISQRAPARPPSTGVRSAGLSASSVSADGRFVAFTSTDNRLTADDTNPWQDVFVRDLETGITALASVPGTGQSGLSNYADSSVLNANGRYVAYLTGRPSTVRTNIVWADMMTGQRKNVLTRGEAVTSPSGLGPAISPDGRYLAFQSMESGYFQTYVRDMFAENGSNELVSVSRFGGPDGGNSMSPTFSPDGRWVAFLSEGGSLVTNPGPRLLQVYVRDLIAKKTRLASYNADGSRLSTRVTNAIFSADSRYLFFHATVSNVVPGVYRHDLLASTTNLIVCQGCKNPSPSADGCLVAVQTVRGSYDAVISPHINDVFVVDTATGQSNLVSINAGGTEGGNGSSHSPLISYDGHYVVFTSKASDIVPNDDNSAADVFVRDRWSGTTMLVSLNRDGTGSGNALSGAAFMAADGRTVFFQSFASDLATGDYNQTRDIFVLKLGGPDSDNDGLEDDWEMAYFSTLARDGTGDYDGDGHTDSQEFRAGSNPANDTSILRVLTLTSLGGGGTTILWNASPGRTYQVQFKNNVDDAKWSELPGLVTAAGTTASLADTTGHGESHRFYRVTLVQ